MSNERYEARQVQWTWSIYDNESDCFILHTAGTNEMLNRAIVAKTVRAVNNHDKLVEALKSALAKAELDVKEWKYANKILGEFGHHGFTLTENATIEAVEELREALKNAEQD